MQLVLRVLADIGRPASTDEVLALVEAKGWTAAHPRPALRQILARTVTDGTARRVGNGVYELIKADA